MRHVQVLYTSYYIILKSNGNKLVWMHRFWLKLKSFNFRGDHKLKLCWYIHILCVLFDSLVPGGQRQDLEFLNVDVERMTSLVTCSTVPSLHGVFVTTASSWRNSHFGAANVAMEELDSSSDYALNFNLLRGEDRVIWISYCRCQPGWLILLNKNSILKGCTTLTRRTQLKSALSPSIMYIWTQGINGCCSGM